MMSFPFIRRGGYVDVQQPPWECDSAWGLKAGLPADPLVLQALCDRVLNSSGGKLHYRPAGPGVLLSLQRIEGFHSTAAPAAECIRYTYGEAAFWVPVVDDEGKLAMLLPYVFHDATVPAAIGRELYGFSKETANIEIAGDRFSVQVLASPLGGGLAAWSELLRLEPTPTPTKQPDLVGKNLFTADDRNKALEALVDAKAAYAMLLSQQFDFIFLRQFVAPEGQGCDVRHLLTVPLTVRVASVPSLTAHANSYRLTLSRLASHPVAQDLGLLLDGQNGADLGIVMPTEFSFTLGLGRRVGG